MASASKKFNYLDNPRKTYAVQNIRVKQACDSTTSATMSQELTFNIPNNVARTVMDSNSMALKFKITNNDETTNYLSPNNGAMSLIKKIDIISNSVTITSIDNYDKISSAFIELDADSGWLQSYGQPLMGTSGNDGNGRYGESIANGASRYVTLPVPLTGLSSLNHYLPMFNKDQLQIRILLNSASQGVICATTGVEDSEIALSDIELIYNQLRMNEEMASAVHSAVGGVYELTSKCFASTQQSKTKASTTETHTLSFNFTDLESVFLLMYSATATGTDTNNSQARSQANLSYFSLLIDGIQFPQRRILGQEAESMLALAKRKGVFNSYSIGNIINAHYAGAFMVEDGTGAADSNTNGQYALCVDLQQQHEAQGQNTLLSGLDTNGATVQARLDFNGASTADQTIVYVAVYSQSLILDMSPGGSGMYSIQS